MIILGISGGVRPGNQDGVAVLMDGGQIIGAAEEERFCRIKHSPGLLPERAIRFCLKQGGLTIHDVDYFASPGLTYKNYEELLHRSFTAQFGYCPPIELVDHHTAHAASAYYASGWDEAMILTADFSGDGASTKTFFAKGLDLEEMGVWIKPNSLGIYYSLITQFLGFRRDDDEYKVMGLSSYGHDEIDLSWLLKYEGKGDYEFSGNYLRKWDLTLPNPSKQEPLYSQEFIKKLGLARLPDGEVTRFHENVAASAQSLLNRTACHIVRHLHQETGSRRLCLAGGICLNCVMNQNLLAMDVVDSVFVQPASSDAGLALGAAYLKSVSSGETIKPFQGASLGSEFSNSEIEHVLKELKTTYK